MYYQFIIKYGSLPSVTERTGSVAAEYCLLFVFDSFERNLSPPMIGSRSLGQIWVCSLESMQAASFCGSFKWQFCPWPPYCGYVCYFLSLASDNC